MYHNNQLARILGVELNRYLYRNQLLPEYNQSLKNFSLFIILFLLYIIIH